MFRNRFQSLLALAGVAVSVLCLSGMGWADEKKDKDKDAKPTVIQLDISKLPPDLAKALLKYATPEKKPVDPKATPQPKGKQPAPAKSITLPPGLAKKSPDHPGRKAYIEEHKKQAEPASKSGKKKD